LAENLLLVDLDPGRSVPAFLLGGLASLLTVVAVVDLPSPAPSSLTFLSDPGALPPFFDSLFPAPAGTEPARSDPEAPAPATPSGFSFFFLPRRCCRYSHVSVYRAHRLQGSSGSSEGKHLICGRQIVGRGRKEVKDVAVEKLRCMYREGGSISVQYNPKVCQRRGISYHFLRPV